MPCPGKLGHFRRTITEEIYKTGEIFEGQVYVKVGGNGSLVSETRSLQTKLVLPQDPAMVASSV